MTPLQTDIFHLTESYLQSKHIKTLATITDSDFPTQAQMNDEVSINQGRYGYSVVGGTTVTTAQSNISAEVSKLASYNAQAVGLFLTLGQNATAVTALKQAGYHGLIFAEEGAANGSLSGAGSAANGIVWATDWVAPGTNPKATSFSKAYQKKYGTLPTNWSAESYDAMNVIAQALKMAGTTDSSKLNQAMTKIGNQKFSGTLGTSLRIHNGQEYSGGFLVQWQNGTQVLYHPTASTSTSTTAATTSGS